MKWLGPVVSLICLVGCIKPLGSPQGSAPPSPPVSHAIRPAPSGVPPSTSASASRGRSANVESPVATKSLPEKTETLLEARKGFVSKLLPANIDPEPLPEPPKGVFDKVAFDSPVGKLGAYITPDPKNGKKNPAIVWITGGDCNSIGDVWSDAPAENDQSAAAYRKAGIVMMFPSLRGGNDNPGKRESFLGEVDDVIAAAEFLARQPYVDPQRIYLGGHSTGGTLVLLVAESTARFRAVFSFGPVGDIAHYGGRFAHFDATQPNELKLRGPAYWLSTIRIPTFVIEGSEGNVESLRLMATMTTNENVRFREISGPDHFNILAPVNRFIAKKILVDTGEKSELELPLDELKRLFSE
jgi:acetyl esterase/lipase